jgi:hypothetical protein
MSLSLKRFYSLYGYTSLIGLFVLRFFMMLQCPSVAILICFVIAASQS